MNNCNYEGEVMKLIDIEESYESLYDFAMAKHFVKHIDAAKLKFVFKEHQEDIQGFNEWFIFNFTSDDLLEPLVVQFAKAHQTPEAKAISKSFRSVFEVTQEDKGFMIRDIFTKDTYSAHTEQIVDTGLVSLRLVVEDSSAIVIGDMIHYDPLYKEVIIKYVLDQYNQMAISSGPKSVQSFLSNHTILLFKMTSIMGDIYEEAIEEEDFLLYQETYALKMKIDDFYGVLNQISQDLSIQKDDEDPYIWNIQMENIQMGEVEVNGDLVAFLFNNTGDRDVIMPLIKTLEGDSFVKIKSEVLTIDELL